jgi:UDP-2,3-diacylglucosamine pyrophosphatase LpxH
MRRIFVISDLHLGGSYPEPGKPGRGFRLCTHPEAVAAFIKGVTSDIAQDGPSELVLNGDTVDFLAEVGEKPGSWLPFTADPEQAVAKFEAIVKRDKVVFEALGGFLENGGRLTVLLGNHDIELSLPAVRAAFRRELGVKRHHDFEFFYDGEAYIVGDALIEHGNRYDAWNQVDYDALRHIRSFQSRRQEVPPQYVFPPPPGSEMVRSVINPIKKEYAFIDLLKPETSAVAPILLALEPGYRSLVATVALLYKQTRSHGLKDAVTPVRSGEIRAERETGRVRVSDIASTNRPAKRVSAGDMAAGPRAAPASPPEDKDDALKDVLREALGKDGESFLRELDAEITEANPLARRAGEIASGTISRILGFASLVFGRRSQSYEKRIPALLKAMRGLQDTRTFDVGTETALEYVKAAKELASRGGFRHVIFGHTHLAKRVDLGNGRLYLNSGTWADVLRFPNEILDSEADARPALQAFVERMKTGDFSAWTPFQPSYVRLDVDGGKVVDGDLFAFGEAQAPDGAPPAGRGRRLTDLGSAAWTNSATP